MILSTEQTVKVDAFVNDFGDFFAQDRSDLRMHEAFVVIRHELAEEAPRLNQLRNHLDWAELRSYLDWVDRILDRIEARRKSTIQIVATRLQAATRHLLH
jgi:hypothetical protein